MATIVFDDDSHHFEYGSGASKSNNSVYYGGSATFVTSDNPHANGHILSVSFSGTSTTVFGWIAQNFVATVSIDGNMHPGTQFVTQDDNMSVVDVLYRSQNLSDTTHNLTISSSSAFAVYIDYATVTVGEDSPLSGEKMIVDESDPSVVFDGAWTQDTHLLTRSNNKFSRGPYGNTTRQTSSMGASATIHFNGSSISVFGSNLLSGSRSQTTVLYTLDKEPTTSMTYDLKSGNPNSSNFNWYHLDGLPKTQHTLKMAVNSADTPFNLDYITYVPSFSSLAEQPQSPPSTPTLSLAKLLGAVIGSVLFIVILILVLLFVRKKKLLFWSSSQRQNTVNPFLLTHPSTQDFSQMGTYNVDHTSTGRNVGSPTPNQMIPLARIDTTSDEINRTPEGRSPETLSRDWYSSIMVQRKPHLQPEIRHSHQSDIGSTDETIVVDPQLQELQEMVHTLQQQIEATRGPRHKTEYR